MAVRALSLVLALLATPLCGKSVHAWPVIDSFETGALFLSVNDSTASQSTGLAFPTHGISPTRTVRLTSFGLDPGPSQAGVFPGSSVDDGLQISFHTSGGDCVSEYVPAAPVDLTNAGLNDRVQAIATAFGLSTGTLELRLWDDGGGFASDTSLVGLTTRTHDFPFAALPPIDLTRITRVEAYMLGGWGVFIIFDLRAMRSDSFRIRFDTPELAAVGPPYPAPLLTFDVLDDIAPVEHAEFTLLDVSSLASGGPLPIALEPTDSGQGPGSPGEVGQITARWNSAGFWEDAAVQLRVDASAVSGVDPSPFLPALPVVTMTATGFALDYEVWQAEFAASWTSQRLLAFDVPETQGLQLVAPVIQTISSRTGTLNGFLVSFDAIETTGVDEAEPLFEVSFTGDYRPGGAVSAPSPFAGVAATWLRAAPSATRGATTLQFGPASVEARVDVFDVTGRLVRSLRVPAGASSVPWLGRNDAGALVGSGLYLARLRDRGGHAVTKITVVR